MENSPSTVDRQALTLPAMGKVPELKLSMDKIIEAEKRLLEAKSVSPATYADLESCYNESYRDLKRHLSAIGYQIALSEKAMNKAKSDMLLDTYPEYLAANNLKKTQDNADLRVAFFMRNEEYVSALDRMNQLKALESSFEGKIKVMENVCRFMRKQMDILLRNSGGNHYVTGR